jgi:hypothetical protein
MRCEPHGFGAIAILQGGLQHFVAGNGYKKLLSHFGEAGTAVLTVKYVD